MPQAPKINRLLPRIGGFINRLRRINFVRVDCKGNSTVKYKLTEEDVNAMGDLHTGLSISLVDVISSGTMLACDGWYEPSLSANINIVRMKGSKVGEELTIESKLLRMEGNLAFLNVKFFNSNGELIIKGEHVKVRSPNLSMTIE